MVDDQVVRVQTLFVSHMPALRGFVTALTSDFSLVDDIMQETFLTITAKADSFQPGTSFRAWAWAVARMKTLEALRTARREKHLAADVIESLCSHDEAFDWSDIDALQRHVAACVESLAARAREVIDLRYTQGHTAAEIARRMGWTTNAIHVALSRARRAIRECAQRRLAVPGAAGT